jgi:hypothetical protein
MLGWTLGLAAIVSAPLALSGKVHARNRVETPRYRVVANHDGFEVRQYAARVVAEVTVKGSAREASNQGFRILAGFIFGANHGAASIEMTSPVDQRPAPVRIAMTAPVDRRMDGDQWVITFTMPVEYTLSTLPEPTDARIRIRELPAASFAVTQVGGSPIESTLRQRKEEFVASVLEAGFHLSGRPSYARYDPPWTPPFLRRNELLAPLTAEQPAAR